jgi:hypothetical protein
MAQPWKSCKRKGGALANPVQRLGARFEPLTLFGLTPHSGIRTDRAVPESNPVSLSFRMGDNVLRFRSLWAR